MTAPRFTLSVMACFAQTFVIAPSPTSRSYHAVPATGVLTALPRSDKRPTTLPIRTDAPKIAPTGMKPPSLCAPTAARPIGGDAAALRAIRITAELAGRYLRCQVRRYGLRCLCENALRRRRWRAKKLLQHSFAHVELRIALPDRHQFVARPVPLSRRKYFRKSAPRLGVNRLNQIFSISGRGPRTA